MRRVAVVGCGASKRPAAAPARELYTSTLFKLARAYAETFDGWYIASARYGFVLPGDVLEPYEYQLEPKQAQQWGQSFANFLVWELTVGGGDGPLFLSREELRARTGHTFPLDVEVTILAGETYAAPIVAGLGMTVGSPCAKARVRAVRQPLTGLGLGHRLAWLKAATRARRRMPDMSRRGTW
jgi:hypothetical protein